MKEIMIAIIPSMLTLVGVVVTVIFGNKRTAQIAKEQTDLTLYRIEQLEKKQDKHNGLIERMYKVEDRLDLAEERQKVTNHRIDDLEYQH